MSEAQEQAQLAYQRALAALHDARTELADLMAARRRLYFDRLELTPEVVAQREAELEAGRNALEARVQRLRAEAEERRAALGRGPGAAGEPTLVEPSGPLDGYEQPPFGPGRA